MRPACLLALLCASLSSYAADWPQYFGPNGDKSSSEIIRTNWLDEPPRELWRVPIGPGFSSMAVAGGRVFTLARSKDRTRELCIALDANTGATLWEADVDAANYSSLSGYDPLIDGPRSTPSVDGERIFVTTSQLKLHCLDAASGTIVWQRDFVAELGSDLIPWENAASPLMVDDLIFLNTNARGPRLTAIRKSDGSTAWSGQEDGLTHATPVCTTIAGERQIIFLTRLGLVAVRPDNGSVLWRLRFSPSSTSTAASPAAAGNYVVASAAYASGAWAAQITAVGETLEAAAAWRQIGNSYQFHWATPVEHGGYLYTIPSPSSAQARLACLDVKDGVNRWTRSVVGSGNIGFGSMIRAADVLIVLTEFGELVLVTPDPDSYIELARFKVLDRYCWNHVALSNGRIYARNTSRTAEMVALDVSTSKALPSFGLQLERAPQAGASLRLTVRGKDGAALDPSQIERLEIRTALDIATPLSQWSGFGTGFKATNGLGTTELSIGAEASRLFSVQEKSE
jgi:outer membrane protein assembly factor BamB